jgi:uncharacterized membrane protein
MFKASYVVRGFPGHPIHPPLTDGAIGAYTAAVVLGCLGAVGVAEDALAKGWWVALLVGLGFGGLSAVTGLVDWLTISWGTPLWRTATWHLSAMLTATVLFLIAALVGHSGYRHAAVDTGPFVLTLAGFGMLTLGGWLGGTVVFVHGMRVLNLLEEPAARAISPGHEPEKDLAEQ